MTTVAQPLDVNVTELAHQGGSCDVRLVEHVHLPAVDGETGAVTILLGLDGQDRDEVRLAVGAGRDARAVLDESIEALLACRGVLEEGGGHSTDGA